MVPVLVMNLLLRVVVRGLSRQVVVVLVVKKHVLLVLLLVVTILRQRYVILPAKTVVL
jgi:hypothetical protein